MSEGRGRAIEMLKLLSIYLNVYLSVVLSFYIFLSFHIIFLHIYIICFSIYLPIHLQMYKCTYCHITYTYIAHKPGTPWSPSCLPDTGLHRALGRGCHRIYGELKKILYFFLKCYNFSELCQVTKLPMPSCGHRGKARLGNLKDSAFFRKMFRFCLACFWCFSE